MKTIACIFLFLTVSFSISAQQKLAWHEPSFVEGVCITDTSNIFHRLPVSMKDQVRKAVWDLSENTAGEFIRFTTSATEIKVRYILSNKNFSMPHMPATGVSGLDLFSMGATGIWSWYPGRYSFGDTCTFTFNNFIPVANTNEFYLYLPLYNSVQWMSVGVADDARFSFSEKKKDKPIVAYGTSIMQGAVASRPGLAWTNILARNINTTIINLGFSGNGRFEKPLFDLMASVDARLYILDCMPNLTGGVSAAEIKERVVYGINKLRERNKSVPVLLVEHAVGYAPFYMDTLKLNTYHRSSIMISQIFNELKSSGIKDIFLLTDKEIAFDINSTTEGLHPNDIGMMKYADAYEKKIRQILKEFSRK